MNKVISESPEQQFAPSHFEPGAEDEIFAGGDQRDLSAFDGDDEQGNTFPEDSWSYETPRPWLSVDEAALMLGRSARGVERSIIGRWGNKLPEGWQARRVRIDGQDEWRIIPPPGFRIKHSKKVDPSTRAALIKDEELSQEQVKEHLRQELAQLRDEREQHSATEVLGEDFPLTKTDASNQESSRYQDFLKGDKNVATSTAPNTSSTAHAAGSNGHTTNSETGGGFSLEKLFQSASQIAQKELASLGINVKNQLMAENQMHSNALDVEHTIVIDRSDEVEKLLRELANVQKELSEERRQHMEDMRLMSQMQNNMRLLEVNATQTSELKEDLKLAQQLLSEHKRQYQSYLALPWWKKIFKSQP